MTVLPVAVAAFRKTSVGEDRRPHCLPSAGEWHLSPRCLSVAPDNRPRVFVEYWASVIIMYDVIYLLAVLTSPDSSY